MTIFIAERFQLFLHGSTALCFKEEALLSERGCAVPHVCFS